MRDMQVSFSAASQAVQEREQMLPKVEHLRRVLEHGGYDLPESALALVRDEKNEEGIKEQAAALHSSALKYLVVVGIGGSNLAAYALYRARRLWVEEWQAQYPKLIFLDTPNLAIFHAVTGLLTRECASKEEFLIFVNSKSGLTLETLALAEALTAALTQHFGALDSRVVVLSDRGTQLLHAAQSLQYRTVETEPAIGGRWSAFSLPQLLPLTLAGLKIPELFEGARSMLERVLLADHMQNPALHSASALAYHNAQGKTVHNTFMFASQLEPMGHWYAQLLAESTGKGGKGMLPITLVGTTALHSLLQRLLDGPNDTVTSFTTLFDQGSDVLLTQLSLAQTVVPELAGNSLAKVNTSIYTAVCDSFRTHDRAYGEVVLPSADERSLGQWMLYKMVEVMLLAGAAGVNAFDQPAVEDYKQAARRAL